MTARCRKVKDKNTCWLLGAQFELCSPDMHWCIWTTSTISFATDSEGEMPLYRVGHPEDEEKKMIHPLHSLFQLSGLQCRAILWHVQRWRTISGGLRRTCLWHSHLCPRVCHLSWYSMLLMPWMDCDSVQSRMETGSPVSYRMGEAQFPGHLSSWGHAAVFPWKQTAEATCRNAVFFWDCRFFGYSWNWKMNSKVIRGGQLCALYTAWPHKPAFLREGGNKYMIIWFGVAL